MALSLLVTDFGLLPMRVVLQLLCTTNSLIRYKRRLFSRRTDVCELMLISAAQNAHVYGQAAAICGMTAAACVSALSTETADMSTNDNALAMPKS